MDSKNAEDDMDAEGDQKDKIIRALWGASYSGTMDGGIVMGGAANTIVKLTGKLGGGGAITGGQATCKVALSYTMKGGISVSGGYDVSGNFTYIAIQTGGQASVRAGYRPRMQGGVTMGGTAACTVILPYVMKGGIVTGGIAANLQSFSWTMTGGIVTGGQSAENETSVYGYTGSGGLSIGGQAILSRAYTYTGSGGVTTGGSVSSFPALTYTGSGGVTTGGQATSSFVMFYAMKGGISISGSIPVPKFALTYQTSGGVAVSGHSRAVSGIAYHMTGGVQTGGQSGNGSGLIVQYSYKPEFPQNRIFIYGKGSYGSDSFSYTMTGGIVMGGLGKIDFCSVSCDTEIPFYRDKEALVGCQVVLPNGKIDYICARPLGYLPRDNNPHSNQTAAFVPSATVCRQSLIKNTLKTKKNCSQFIRK